MARVICDLSKIETALDQSSLAHFDLLFGNGGGSFVVSEDNIDAVFYFVLMGVHCSTISTELEQLAAKHLASTVEVTISWSPAPGVTSAQEIQRIHELTLSKFPGATERTVRYPCHSFTDPSYIQTLLNLIPAIAPTSPNTLRLCLLNPDLPHLRLIHSLGIPISKVQVAFSVLDRRPESTGLSEWCAENGVGVIADGVLLGGFLDEVWLGKEEPVGLEGDLMKWKGVIDSAGGWAAFQTLLQTLFKIALKYSTTIPSIAVSFVFSMPSVVSVVLPAFLDQPSLATTISHLAGQAITLDATDLADIATAKESLSEVPGECGDEYRRGGCFADDPGEEERRKLEIVEKAIADGRRVEMSSGSMYEPIMGYCRANRIGNILNVSGTTSSYNPTTSLPIGGKSTYLQTVNTMDIMERALLALGGSWSDVVRMRILLINVEDWMEVGRHHGRVFKRAGVRPVNTTVGGTVLVDENLLVEIEAYAVVGAKGKVLRI